MWHGAACMPLMTKAWIPIQPGGYVTFSQGLWSSGPAAQPVLMAASLLYAVFSDDALGDIVTNDSHSEEKLDLQQETGGLASWLIS